MKTTKVVIKPKYPGDYLVIKPGEVPKLQVVNHILTGYDSDTFLNPELDRQVVIPVDEDVERIDNQAFHNLWSLYSVRFRHKAYHLGSEVFAGCKNLETVTLAENTRSVPMGTFSDCKSLRIVHLPDTVTTINMDAFKNCGALPGIDLPAQLKTIEVGAFCGCRNLKKLHIPAAVTEIGTDAFANCTSLEEVILPSNLELLGDCAFLNCAALEEIWIPPQVTTLPVGVFAGCKNLKRIILPEGIQHISPYAFYGCDRLEEISLENPERFTGALRNTPYWKKRHPEYKRRPQVPMALLQFFAGDVSGTVLSAMGYPWFDMDRDYQIYLTEHPDVYHIRAQYAGEDGMGYYDYWLLDSNLEPIGGIEPLVMVSDIGFRVVEATWERQKKLAFQTVDLGGGMRYHGEN